MVPSRRKRSGAPTIEPTNRLCKSTDQPRGVRIWDGRSDRHGTWSRLPPSSTGILPRGGKEASRMVSVHTGVAVLGDPSPTAPTSISREVW